ncbi:MAG: ATP-binding cassette domain-containing protein, partial [Alphaproteobacteria bacterium]
ALIFEDPAIRLNFPEVEKLPSPIISYDKLNIGYDNIPVLKHVGGSIMSDDRIALLGANGNGKSTFAKLLAKELKPQSGEFTMYEKLRIGYFNQHQYENLELDRTPIDHLTKIMVGQSEMNVRTHLGSFGFQREKATTLVGKLSGGEKARLVFSMITCLKPHILILDEPTNHLDIDMRESLIFAINDFNGAVILISHDLHLIENTIDKLWIVKDQKIGPFNGSIEEYRDSLLK